MTELRGMPWLRTSVAYAIEHTPNIHNGFLARLPGQSGKIDHKHIGETEDLFGYGETDEEALRSAALQDERLRNIVLPYVLRQFPLPWRMSEDQHSLLAADDSRVGVFLVPIHIRGILAAVGKK